MKVNKWFQNMIKASIMAFFLIAVLGFWGLKDVQSATYYVDWDSGSDLTGDGSAGNPWKTPWHADGQLSSGDTVTVYAKNDGSPYNNGTSEVISASTANTTWVAASGETARLSITSTWGDTTWVGTFKPVISLDASNVTIDGFYVWGQILAGASADNSTIQNCDLSGGNGGRDNFTAVVYLHGTSASGDGWCDGVTIKNCKLHDNIDYIEGIQNEPLIMVYDAKGMIVENCEFYNSVGDYHIRLKDNPNGHIIRYSFFRTNATMISLCYQGCGISGYDDTKIYQNVFVGATSNAIEMCGNAVMKTLIYNNTFYNCAKDYGHWGFTVDDMSIFNNIFYHSSGGQYHVWDDSPKNWAISKFDYLDYNAYYTASGSTTWGIPGKYITTLSQWQTFLDNEGCSGVTCGDNSVNSDPGFNPDDGTLDGSDPTDFKRTSYPTNGRGGSYPSVMGAYITGNEIIGPQLYKGWPPAPPKNLRLK